ncbi:MAG: CCA tRNA nucleotidyltransferase [Alphaproteobacteria bacterium]|nr:CCA tRNA nucleotidyltransferase [Alphaproteobacteria bacterium]MCW5741779.1 CCA tRNA nucleotidyltransferase [Alphaproteobacteria bacterium]
MTDAPTTRLLSALSAAGIGARFVGGCVRNALLGMAPGDLDIAVDRPPTDVTAALRAAGIKVAPTGIAHGTVTAVVDRHPYEITTLRRDVETDGRRAVVAFTDDWREDAARRDFTINAMSCDASGVLWDYFGGRDDLARHRVRFVGDPDTRITEDVLRVMRFFRFHAWYGRPPLDPDGLAACRRHAGKLRGLSAERVRAELLRLLAADDPADVVEAMATCGAFDHWLPQYQGTARLRALIANERLVGAGDGLRRLAALLDPATDAAAFGKRLKLSTQQGVRLQVMLAALPVIDATDAAIVRKQVYRLGGALYIDRLLLDRGAASDAQLMAAHRLARDWPVPELPIGGADVIRAGVRSGPDVGVLIDAVEAWWVARDFVPDRQACLAELARLIAAR